MIDTLLTGLTLRRRLKALSDYDYADKRNCVEREHRPRVEESNQ